MVELRGEEIWAAQLIAAALGDVEVVQHDDGSQPSMYDLDVMRNGRRFAAVEVTAAADGDSIFSWLAGAFGGRWSRPA